MTIGKVRVVSCFVASLALVACSDSSDGGQDLTSTDVDAGDAGTVEDSGPRDATPGDVLVDECAEGTDACATNATCTDLPKGFKCECKAGYSGNGLTCDDVDECQKKTDDCAENATCTNTAGAFTCKCNDGFKGNGKTCADIDECAEVTDDCGENSTCENTPGSFTCTCNGGYTGDGTTCDDVDECMLATDDCGENATCTNAPGTFSCACNAGFTGDGHVCADVDECTANTDNCDALATCTNTVGAFTCACPGGTTDVAGNGTSCVAVGQTCAQAVVIAPATLPVTLAGNTAFATPHYGFGADGCGGVAGPVGGASNDVVYSFTPTTTSSYTFTLTGSGFDSALYLATDCDAIGTSCVAAVDVACTGCAEQLTATLTAGTTYFVIVDGSSDATNASGAYTLTAKPARSFANPLLVDVSALLTQDTVVNNGNGALDLVQDPIDGSGYKLATQSAARAIRAVGTNYALPDDGTFAADANHPAIRLGWNNANDGPNSRIVKTAQTFTIPVPADTYTQFQVYAVSSEGPSSMQFTLNYADGTSDTKNVTFGDWYDDPARTGTFFVLDGLDRINATNGYDAAHDPALAGASLNPNTTKTLTSVVVNHLTSNGWFVFYGAAAW